MALAERLFGPDPKTLPGYWFCVHADCEGFSACQYGDKRLWRPA